MGRYFPKINLRPDLPPGSEVDKPHAVRRKGYILLLVGLVFVVALFLHLKGKNRKESPQILVKVDTIKSKKKEATPPPSPEPQTPQEKKESSPSPPSPSPEKTIPEKTLEVRLPQPTEKVPVQEKTTSKIQLPSSSLAQEESPQPVKKGEEEKVTRLQIILFPGLHPVKVKNTLDGKGIEFKEENREVTTTLWRVMVETSPSSSDKDRQKLKELTGSTPWRLKKGKKLYLVVFSLKEKEPSQDLAKKLESKGFKAQVAPITKKVTLKVLVFPIQEKEWEKLRTILEKLGAQVVESGLLDHSTPLSQPVSTTSQGKGSASSLPR